MTLNERCLKESRAQYYIGYTTADGDERVFKKGMSAKKLVTLSKKLVDDGVKIDKEPVEAIYVNDTADNEFFVALKNEDDTWDIVLDTSSSMKDYAYRDTLFNRVYYSLTAMPVENMNKLADASLLANIITTDNGGSLDWETGCGYYQDDDGNTVLNISIDRTTDEDNAKAIKWLYTVAEHFGLDVIVRPMKNKFKIIVPEKLEGLS